MITLSAAQQRAIAAHGEKAFPNECCGVILGTIVGENGEERTAAELLPIENAREASEQYHRFVITAEDFMRSELEAAKRGLEIVGFYHSHPNAPAKPSQYDQDHALPFYSYAIVSVLDGKADALTSWQLTLDRSAFLEETIALPNATFPTNL
ncbi:hypothetical protein AGMMS50229_10430 [Campylobacterota bacterium]|nr:hypothetical protein AGMMS50229_10430 [Campylobacterota bacterium]